MPAMRTVTARCSRSACRPSCTDVHKPTSFWNVGGTFAAAHVARPEPAAGRQLWALMKCELLQAELAVWVQDNLDRIKAW